MKTDTHPAKARYLEPHNPRRWLIRLLMACGLAHEAQPHARKARASACFMF